MSPPGQAAGQPGSPTTTRLIYNYPHLIAERKRLVSPPPGSRAARLLPTTTRLIYNNSINICKQFNLNILHTYILRFGYKTRARGKETKIYFFMDYRSRVEQSRRVVDSFTEQLTRDKQVAFLQVMPYSVMEFLPFIGGFQFFKTAADLNDWVSPCTLILQMDHQN